MTSCIRPVHPFSRHAARPSTQQRSSGPEPQDHLWLSVQLPSDVSRYEWIAMSTINFFNQIRLLINVIGDFCTNESCPKMTAGPHFEFLWHDHRHTGTSDQQQIISCSAPVYIQNMMLWVEALLDDHQLLPLDHSTTFEYHIKQIYKRMFRFYAHAYYSHYRQIHQLGELDHFNLSFRHFILFSFAFQLLDYRDVRPLSSLVNSLLMPFTAIST